VTPDSRSLKRALRMQMARADPVVQLAVRQAEFFLEVTLAHRLAFAIAGAGLALRTRDADATQAVLGAVAAT
jgi:hypothetical protein